MIVELTIKNVAVIKEVTIRFQTGLNILTGETGAGKSILIDSIGLLLGARGSAEYVRYGESKAEIEALFELNPDQPALKLLPQLGIECPDDRLLIVRREISAQGRSICRVNGQLVTLAALREIGPWLVNIHGQHQHQSLMIADRHLEWVDAFAGADIKMTLEEFKRVYKRYRTAKLEWEQLTKSEAQLAQRQDMLAFQLEEITEADLVPLEDEELTKEKSMLLHSEKLFSGLEDAYSALTAEQASLDWVGLAMSHLERIAEFDDRLSALLTQTESAFFQLEETARGLRTYREQIEFDPDRLTQIEHRLAEIHRLKRKYGQDVEAVLEYAAQIEDELDVLLHREQRLQVLEQTVADLAKDLALEAVELSNERKKAADRLAAQVESHLRDLQMEQAKFAAEIRQEEDPEGIDFQGKKVRVAETGIDRVEFMISANPGEPLRPVAKVASGGELSRIMLGMKATLAELESTETFIFDEIDTGVSGRAAQAIAEKLVAVSRHKQVLCITHLPQMACMADAHFFIAKETMNEETRTDVKRLEDEGRVAELARLLGGVEVTETTREHAREMLRMAVENKRQTAVGV